MALPCVLRMRRAGRHSAVRVIRARRGRDLAFVLASLVATSVWKAICSERCRRSVAAALRCADGQTRLAEDQKGRPSTMPQ